MEVWIQNKRIDLERKPLVKLKHRHRKMTSESSSNIDFETFGGLMFYRRNLDRDFQ
jgi:hypothetical protein